jgi:hypothetical protein
MRLTTRPTREAGIDVVGVGVLVWVVGCGVAVAGCVAVGVPLGEVEVAVPVAVAGGVVLVLGRPGEDPQAAATSISPTAKVVTLASRTDDCTLARLLRYIHCRATESGLRQGWWSALPEWCSSGPAGA